MGFKAAGFVSQHSLRFKLGSGYAGLPNNGLEGTDSDFVMLRYGYSCRALCQFLLHHEWLPRLRTSTKPCLARIAHTSRPERTRSLPNGNLDLCHENLAVEPSLRLLSRSCFEEQFQRFFEIRTCFLNGAALAGDVNFRAQSHISMNGGSANWLTLPIQLSFGTLSLLLALWLLPLCPIFRDTSLLESA